MNFHVMVIEMVAELFEKQTCGLTDLKNFYCGCLLNAPDDPAIDLNFFISMKTLALWLGTERDLQMRYHFACRSIIWKSNRSSQSWQWPLWSDLLIWSFVMTINRYCSIDCPGTAIFEGWLSSAKFLISHLVDLSILIAIDSELIPKVLIGLKSFSWFEFKYLNKRLEIQIDFWIELNLRQYQVKINGVKETDVSDPARIQFIIENDDQFKAFLAWKTKKILVAIISVYFWCS